MIVIIDTNVLISADLIKQSISDRTVRKAFLNNVVIRSMLTTLELTNTLKNIPIITPLEFINKF